MSKDYKVTGNLIIENARLIFRNFSGEASKYNRKGDRNFCVVIEDQNCAEELKANGWNIKMREPRDEGDMPLYYLQVKVNFDSNPIPNITMITSISRNKTQLFEDGVGVLDYAHIENADVIINPYNWEVNGSNGVTAYLKTLYVTIEEDPFAAKY